MSRTPKSSGLPKETCSYQYHHCSQARFENYNYCFRHILQDTNAPFKQCGYINLVTNRQCNNPTTTSVAHCSEHMKKMRPKTNRIQPPRTAETLVSNLSHYVKTEVVKEATCTASTSQQSDSGESDKRERERMKFVNPFVDIDGPSVNNAMHQVLDYCSDSDSDVDVVTVDDTVRVKEEDSSDDESIDWDNDAVLKNAEVFTIEEASGIIKEKLSRLRDLHTDQFKRLDHVLKEKRRDYLTRLQKEKELHCSIANQPKTTLKEQRMYQKLKCMNRYRKKLGVDAILHKKALEKRTLATEGISSKTSTSSKCVFTEGGVKCSLKTLPCAKYCCKHILADANQCLFKKCGVETAGSVCEEPVMGMYGYECVFHHNLPSMNLVYNTSISSEEEEEKIIPKNVSITKIKNETIVHSYESVMMESDSTMSGNVNIIKEEEKINLEDLNITEEEENIDPENVNITEEEENINPENVNITEEEEKINSENVNITEEEENINPENVNIIEEEENINSENVNITEDEENFNPENETVTEEEENIYPENVNITEEEENINPENVNIIEEEENIYPGNVYITEEEENINPENENVTEEEEKIYLGNVSIIMESDSAMSITGKESDQKLELSSSQIIMTTNSKEEIKNDSLVKEETILNKETETNEEKPNEETAGFSAETQPEVEIE